MPFLIQEKNIKLRFSKMSDFSIQCEGNFSDILNILNIVTGFVTRKSVIQNVRLFLDNATVEGVKPLLLLHFLE